MSVDTSWQVASAFFVLLWFVDAFQHRSFATCPQTLDDLPGEDEPKDA